MCSYWVHVVESLRIVAVLVIALSCGTAVINVGFSGDDRDRDLLVWGSCAAAFVLCVMFLVFAPTGDIVSGWCS